MSIFIGLLWFFVGCIIAIPYTYLANGEFHSVILIAWFTPFWALFLFVIYTKGGSRRRQQKRLNLGNGLFWALIIYFCLPIILNGTSLLLKWAKYEVIGHYIFEGRYLSLLVVPMFLIIYCLIANGVMSLRQRFGGSGNATPPPNTPPNKQFRPVTKKERRILL